MAAIIPLSDDEDLERLMLGYSPKLRAILSAARRRIRDGQGIAHQKFWREARKRKRSKSSTRSGG